MSCLGICEGRRAKDVELQIKSLANETRIRILLVLQDGAKQLNEIVQIIDKPYPSVIKHMGVLIKANWVEKTGKRYPVYTLSNSTLTERIMSLCHMHCLGIGM
ncbi:MAG: winged helix-turn-helix transcriptional regulator [Rhodospirillaceae bacterium]|jgi:predicted transcriptional regulator|nr:winged helix-turn-helix transcriptional regulator [Rhodospirillaceae bacterium]